MTDKLTQQDQELIQDESELYQTAHQAVFKEWQLKARQFQSDEVLARELTSQIVGTRREEDKQALQSDEQVAHHLTKLRWEQNRSLGLLVEQPYFARVIYQEKGKQIEFKLGLASFPEQRIVDWRKAPISKLYYDYEEGDCYDTDIAGASREGQVMLRRAYQGRRAELSNIELKDVSYVQSRGKWYRYEKMPHATFTLKEKEKIQALLKNYQDKGVWEFQEDKGYLGQILSLLSPEQFCLISTESHKPVIIQGSAGTGKTTVALHRLAWLLFEGNSQVKEEQALVMVFNKSLAAYIKHVLPEMGIQKVKIATFAEWALDIIQTHDQKKITLSQSTTPRQVCEFKSQPDTLAQLLLCFEENKTQNIKAQELLYLFYQKITQDTFSYRVRDAETVSSYLHKQIIQRQIDYYDLALLLHLVHVRQGFFRAKTYPGFLDYLVIDEAQDFSSLELSAMFKALGDVNQLTLAGDLGQKIHSVFYMSDWNLLLQDAGLEGIDVINLRVAYRSTYQIYELSEYIRNPFVKEDDLEFSPRFGPEPVLTLCHALVDAVSFARDWLDEVLNKSRNTIGAIICKTQSEARQVYDALIKQGVRGIRLGDASHFEFTPGITITDVKQVKGLEFSNVLIFNPSETNFVRDDLQDQNFLYVAVTRASYRVDFVCFDPPTSLIPDFVHIKDMTLVKEDDSDQPLFSDVDQDLSRFEKDNEEDESF